MGSKLSYRKSNPVINKTVKQEHNGQTSRSVSWTSHTNNAAQSTSRCQTSSAATAPQLKPEDRQSYNTVNDTTSSLGTPGLIVQDLDHDLLGIAAQFDRHGNTMKFFHGVADPFHAPPCPHHQAMLELSYDDDLPTCIADGLSSYQHGSPEKPYALYLAADSSALYTVKDCSCFQKWSDTGF